MKISVVICTHDRVALLRKTISSLNKAIRPKRCSVELRVVANGCADGTMQFLRDYETSHKTLGRLPMSWEEEPVLGKSRALNRILPKIKGDIIAFVDDDHRVDRNYLNAICEAAHRYSEASLFCGRILPDWSGNEPSWVHERGRYRIYPLPIPRFDLGDLPRRLTRDIAVPGGGNLVVRTELRKKVGEFSVDLGPVGHSLSGGEDLQWVLRAFRSGARSQYVPDIVQYHYVDPGRLTLMYLMRKAYRRSAASVEFSNREVVEGRFPIYLLRKLIQHAIAGFLAVRHGPRRFHLVRAAACLGEINGFHRRHKMRAHVRERAGLNSEAGRWSQVESAPGEKVGEGRLMGKVRSAIDVEGRNNQ